VPVTHCAGRFQNYKGTAEAPRSAAISIQKLYRAGRSGSQIAYVLYGAVPVPTIFLYRVALYSGVI